LIYDWNLKSDREVPRPAAIAFDDETLRDGLQGPSVFDPPIESKRKILHLMNSLGIETADIGLPGAGPRAVADVAELCKEIRDHKLNVQANAPPAP
jgi:2-isopropylmalate synthase